MLTNKILAQTIIDAFLATDPDKNNGYFTGNEEIVAFRNWYYQNFSELLTIANATDPQDDPTLTSYHSLAAEIDYSELSEFIDYSSIADNIDESNIAEHLDASEIAGYIDYYELSQQISHSDLAEEYNVYDIADYISVADIAENIDLDDLANVLIHKLKDKLV